MTKSMWKKILLPSLVLASISACSWVEETASGQRVNVVGAANVTHCQKIGTTSVEVKDDLVLGLERNHEKVANELATLARNRAGENGADSIVAITPVENGKQKFAMYRCGN